ncbi:unnamed protein product [Heligmosomoides polygyrus]|uniref:RRM domain-containing protein n=1 Tax=Heligmosomoides polygyrus TaxID=6339 RepID=A0A3P8BUB0_HELPZ|nr:unnamed protein product [Heligmosomoides polygyrus]
MLCDLVAVNTAQFLVKYFGARLAKVWPDLDESQRGPDELLSSIHGNILASVMTVDSEPKKAKLDPTALYSQYISQMNGLTTAQLLAGQPLAQIAAPTHCTASSSTPRSRVVHIRNIPPDMVDVELIQLCVPYGPLSNYMMLKGKSQAFVEYEDEHSAVGFVTSMNAVPIQVSNSKSGLRGVVNASKGTSRLKHENCCQMAFLFLLLEGGGKGKPFGSSSLYIIF